MLRVPNVATPLTGVTVVVPDRTAPLVPVPLVIATVTPPTNVVSMFPNASCAATCTAGAIALPAAVVLGWTPKARRLAGAGAVAQGALVAPDSPLAVALKLEPLPPLSTLSSDTSPPPPMAARVVDPH